MLWSPILLGAKRAWNALASGLGGPWGAGRDLPAAAPGGDSGLALKTPNHKIAIDEKTARLLSLRSTLAPGQEFIVSNEKMPVFVIQYLTPEKKFQQISSLQAREVKVQAADKKITAEFTGLGGLDLAATVTIRTEGNDPATYWSISIRNRARLAITEVQFPFVTTPYNLGGKPGSEALLSR